MGSFQKRAYHRYVPLGLILGLVGCAGTNRTISWQEPRPQGPISRFMNSRAPSQETTATIVTVPEPGQALPPNNAGSEATPEGTVSTGDPNSPDSTTVAKTGPTPLSPPPVSEKVSRFFPLFKRQSTVNLPIPPKPPLPNAEALNALANQPKEAQGEGDVWAETARSRALALLESDRAKARLKPRSDPRTGTTGVLAAREARPPYELADNQESVLPVSLEINTNGARDRAAIARPVNRPGRHMSDAIAGSAMRQAQEPKPDPWSPYANAEAMSGSKTAVTLGTPTDANTVTVTEPAKLIDEPAQPEAVAAQPTPEPALPEPAAPAQEQPEPAKEAEVAEAAPVATEPESDAIPPVSVAEATSAPSEPEVAKEEQAAEPPAPSISVASPSPAETESAPAPAPSIPTAAAEPVDLPTAAPAVPEREPVAASQEVAAPGDTPREVPLTLLTDQIELPPEIDAESESRSASKLEPATERVSLSETSATANVVPTRDRSDMVTDPPKEAPAQPKATEKAAAKPPTSEVAQPAPAAKPAESPAAPAPKAPAATSTANDPPVPQPAADPEPKPADPKPSEPKAEEAPKQAAEEKPAVSDVAKPSDTTPPTPAPAAEPAPAPSAAPAVVPTPKKSIQFPRMTRQVGQGGASPQSPAAVAPMAPNKVLPAPVEVSPEPLTASRPAPSKAMPAADPNQDPGRVPIWSPYNNLPAQTQPELAVPSKAKPSESPTAGWKIPPRVPKQSPAMSGAKSAPAPSKVFPTPQLATATSGTASILANRDQVVGSYDLNGLFPATYQGAITRGAPPVQRSEGSGSRMALSSTSKRKTILGRFIARFQREADDTPVPTPADAIAGRVNPQGLWKVTPLRPTAPPESIAAEPRDIPQGGEGIQRVSAYGLDEPPQR